MKSILCLNLIYKIGATSFCWMWFLNSPEKKIHSILENSKIYFSPVKFELRKLHPTRIQNLSETYFYKKSKLNLQITRQKNFRRRIRIILRQLLVFRSLLLRYACKDKIPCLRKKCVLGRCHRWIRRGKNWLKLAEANFKKF